MRCTRAVDHPLGNDKAFPRLQINRLVFQVDDEVTVKDKEELIVVVMLVPVVLALHHAQAHDGIVDLAERLVVPLIRASLYEGRYINDRERRELDVEERRVRIGLIRAHEVLQQCRCKRVGGGEWHSTTDALGLDATPNVQGNRRAAPTLAIEKACAGASG
jgi:hypothetical protein